MSMDLIKNNLKQIKEIIRELYIFSIQFDAISNLEITKDVVINKKEKQLLGNVINSLTNQLRILNNTFPDLIQEISFYKPIPAQEISDKKSKVQKKSFTKIQYQPSKTQTQVSYVINEKDRAEFLKNLSMSRLSINKLKKRYSVEKQVSGIWKKPSVYSKISNNLFKKFANNLISEGYFNKLNRNLRKINSQYVLRTYVSMVLFSVLLGFIIGFFLFIFLLFFNLSLFFPFISLTEETILIRFFKFFWLIFAAPIGAGLLVYFYPASEAKNIGSKINQELPFAAIHMSAIASSGIDPINIFKIILKGGEYKYISIEIKKLMNLINFHGEDITSALKKISFSSPSAKLKELFNGLAVTLTSGGELHQFLSKHAENLLLDYKLEREKYTKVSETFMDIYISIAIASPMVFLMIFVIIAGTGITGGFMGLSINILSLLMIFGVIVLNLIFLLFLKIKQPVI